MSAYEIIFDTTPLQPEIIELVIDYLCFPRVKKLVKTFDRQTEWITSIMPSTTRGPDDDVYQTKQRCRILSATCSKNLIWISTYDIVTVYNLQEKLAEFSAHGKLIAGLHDDCVLEANDSTYTILQLKDVHSINIMQQGNGKFDVFNSIIKESYTIIAHASSTSLMIDKYQDGKMTRITSVLIIRPLNRIIIDDNTIIPCGDNMNEFKISDGRIYPITSIHTNGLRNVVSAVRYKTHAAYIDKDETLSLYDTTTQNLLNVIKKVDEYMLGEDGLCYSGWDPCEWNPRGYYLHKPDGKVIYLLTSVGELLYRIYNNIMIADGIVCKSIDDELNCKHCNILGCPVGYIGKYIIMAGVSMENHLIRIYKS